MADIAGAYNRTTLWSAYAIPAATGRNIAALRDWVVTQGGGPSYNDLQSIHVWLNAYTGPFTPPDNGGGGG